LKATRSPTVYTVPRVQLGEVTRASTATVSMGDVGGVSPHAMTNAAAQAAGRGKSLERRARLRSDLRGDGLRRRFRMCLAPVEGALGGRSA
jgi:hypothetical protein